MQHTIQTPRGEVPAEGETRVQDQDARRAALADIYRKRRRLTYVVALGLLRNPDRAEDAVHETFLRALGGLDISQDPRAISKWLMVTARRVAVDMLRHEGASPVTMRLRLAEERGTNGHQADALPAPERTPDEEAIEHEELLRLRAAVAALPERDRDIVQWYYIAGQTQTDIARALGISVRSVQYRLEKTRDRLRRELAPHAAARAA